jgi:hypothetical protein
MGTWEVLEWIGGATTDRAAAVRQALWWLFFVSNKYQLKRKLDEAELEVGDAIYFVCVDNVCITLHTFPHRPTSHIRVARSLIGRDLIYA